MKMGGYTVVLEEVRNRNVYKTRLHGVHG